MNCKTGAYAVVSMIDSNLKRERISPCEKAFAYKMKYDVNQFKGKRILLAEDNEIM